MGVDRRHLHVACALIEKEGLLLAARRSAAMTLPGKWEFPGGKIEAGETPQECLLRELQEELAITVVIGRPLSPSTHGYDDFIVTLYPFLCALATTAIVLREHDEVRWLAPGDLFVLDWAEADLPILREYLAGGL